MLKLPYSIGAWSKRASSRDVSAGSRKCYVSARSLFFYLCDWTVGPFWPKSSGFRIKTPPCKKTSKRDRPQTMRNSKGYLNNEHRR